MQSALTLTPVDSQERRQNERHVTIFKVAKVVRQSGEELCVLRNLSTQGAKADVAEPYYRNEEVIVKLRLGEPIRARVVWVSGRSIGMVFCEHIDPQIVLANICADEKRLSGPRVNILAEGNIVLGHDTHEILLENLSQKGARILGGSKLLPGTDLSLELEGLGIIPAVVRWTDLGISGLAFNTVLPVWDMMRWIKTCSRHDAGLPLLSTVMESISEKPFPSPLPTKNPGSVLSVGESGPNYVRFQQVLPQS